MKLSTFVLFGVGGFFAIAAMVTLTAPKVRAAVRATFVEVVIPSNPFFASAHLAPQSPTASRGPDTGTLGVTNITLTNYESVSQRVDIFPAISPTGCSSGIIGRAPGPSISILVAPNSTQAVTYPTPLVFGPFEGHACIGVNSQGNVDFFVNGFVN